MMSWNWTGIRRDPKTGKTKRNGWEWTIGRWFRMSYFTIPSKGSMDGRNKRLCLEIGRFHGLFTWNAKNDIDT